MLRAAANVHVDSIDLYRHKAPILCGSGWMQGITNRIQQTDGKHRISPPTIAPSLLLTLPLPELSHHVGLMACLNREREIAFRLTHVGDTVYGAQNQHHEKRLPRHQIGRASCRERV